MQLKKQGTTYPAEPTKQPSTRRLLEKGAPVKYGTYRETYDPDSERLNLVNLICVPSPREFEWMIAHSATALMEQEAK